MKLDVLAAVKVNQNLWSLEAAASSVASNGSQMHKSCKGETIYNSKEQQRFRKHTKAKSETNKEPEKRSGKNENNANQIKNSFCT